MRLLAALTLAGLLAPASARAQGAESRATTLAEEFSNPLTRLPQLFLQDATRHPSTSS
jgi:hypothetical protein